MQGDTRHSGWLPHGKLLVWAEPLCLPFIYRLAVPAADHPCTSLPGTARAAGAASFPWRGGKDLFDQTLPSRAVNQSPGNASSTRAPAPPAKSPNTIQQVKAVRRICLMRILQHRAGSKVSHQKRKPQLPLHTSLHITHLEGTRCTLLGKERSSGCSGDALPAGGCSKINACTPEDSEQGRCCALDEEL